MAEYIEYITKHRAKHFVCEFCNEHCGDDPCEPSDCEWMQFIESEPAADVAPVVHGRWVLTVHSFYRDTFDESCELCVYIVANCSECSGKHPNSYQVYSKTLYAPEDANNDFRFNQKAEEEKALLEFKQRKIEYANYCPNCGARMDGEG